MNFRKLFTRKISFVFLLLSFSILSSGIQDYSQPEALKVLKAIEKMEGEQSRGDKDPLKKIVITEKELNSYIAYRIETEKEEIMKELRLKLFKKNKIEGKVLIDLRGQKIPEFIRPQMTLYFGGKLEVEKRKARLNIKDLFLEDQRVKPTILDVILNIASKIQKTEVSSMNDWYELPYGIKDIKTSRRAATFYY
jgi:ribosome-binding ATPase YchF (GTP1/OBG family)